MRTTDYLFFCSLAVVAGQQLALAGEQPDILAQPAAIAPPDSLVVPAAEIQAPTAPPRAASMADLFGAQPIAIERLARMRGGADTVSNDMTLTGNVANNTAINVISGMNTISNGSFSNASGLPVAIQNSGANVLIQNATIINVQLQ